MNSGFVIEIGPLGISETVIITWGIMAVLVGLGFLLTLRLRLDPDSVQVALEGIVSGIEASIVAILPEQGRRVLPFVGTLWIFIVVSNLAGLIPGLTSPTGNLSVTAGLAILVFFSVHWFGIRSNGLKRYLRHYIQPNPLLFPFHVVSELTRTVARAARLFGNMMSLEMAALLVLMVAGFLVPIPILMLHIVEALVQAYIFGMLALIYIAGGIQSQQLKRTEQKE
jgi:F-type H+-transporting ATPase subunit a